MDYGSSSGEQNADQLLTGFNKTRTFSCLLVAAVLHVAVVGGSSVPFIHQKAFEYFYPEEAAERKAAAEKAQEEKTSKETEKLREDEEAATEKSEEPEGKQPEGKRPGVEKPAGTTRKKGPTERQTKTLPEEGEIPEKPDKDNPLDDELGLGIDETGKAAK